MNIKAKSKFILVFIGVMALLLFSVVALCSCSDGLRDTSFTKDEDYIEVKSLRINSGSANISMSSSGEPSKYQLDIKTVPENATNRNLTYYIPSEYHTYLTVSSTGLLTAHATTGDQTVEVIVRSTSNTKAALTVTVNVEDVAVKEVKFAQESLSLLYNGKPGQVSVVYKPSHATDGRNASFVSLDENICTVSSDGIVTPVNAGQTTIKATCITRGGKEIVNFMSVTVSYATGQYQLDVSGTPSFNQIIGNFSAIDFTLLILGENVDPNPDISWYVDTVRVAENEDKLQYSHIPTSTTQLTYHIYVYITPYQGSTVTLVSDPITVYKAFTGITLNYDNLSSTYTSYRYGDTATFALNSGDTSSTITKYSWVLAEAANPRVTTKIATTYPTDRNLTRRINVSGDFSLTARGLDANDNLVNQTMFTFSSEKLVEGDTLIVRPSPNETGLPPDSYHWYVVPCDDLGNYNPSDKKFYIDTPGDAPLYYSLASDGNFRFLVTASIGGLPATVMQGSESIAYEYVSDVIRVYSADHTESNAANNLINTSDPMQKRFVTYNYSAINKLYIEGLGRDKEKQVCLKWNNIEHVPCYIVEVTKDDGTVIIVDSSETKDNECTFGSNYVYLHKSIATLNDVFSVRIKQKGGLYSRTFYYGTPNDKGVGDDTHILSYSENTYSYFSTIGYNNANNKYSVSQSSVMNAPAINGYVSDMEELSDIIAFILLFRPSENTYITSEKTAIDNVLYDRYTIDLHLAFVLSDAEKAKYPSGLTTDELTAFGSLSYVAEMIYGAANTLPYGFDFLLTLEELNNGIRVGFNIPNTASQDSALISTPTKRNLPTDSTEYAVNGSTIDTTTLPINLKDPFYVRNSESLVFAVEKGYNPVPQGNSNIANLYTVICNLVARLSFEEYTSAEKALAFATYLANHTTLDGKIDEIMAEGGLTDYQLYLYKAFRLESVFTENGTTTDVGLAKAFSVMCGISGIPCMVVKGVVGDKVRTFNKVCCDGQWYIVDIAYGMYGLAGYSVCTNSAFMIDEDGYSALFGENITVEYLGEAPTALGNIEKTYVEISDDEGLKTRIGDLVNKVDSSVYGIELSFTKTTYANESAISEAFGAIDIRGVTLEQSIIKVYEDNDIIRVIALITIRK